jgi:uncharacterized protein
VILETIVTTRDAGGRVNVAPMGVVDQGDAVILRPYRETTTYRNLLAVPYAVIHLIDDTAIYARSALGEYEAEWVPAAAVPGAVLTAACSWIEVSVAGREESEERATIRCQVVHRGRYRDFVGYNRARNAILEATILATRTRFLPVDDLWRDLRRLEVIVAKCGDQPERETMAFVMEHVRRVAGDQRATSRS